MAYASVVAKIVSVGIADFDTMIFSDDQATFAENEETPVFVEAELPDFIDARMDDQPWVPTVRLVCSQRMGEELAPYLVRDQRVILEVLDGVIRKSSTYE